MSNNDELAVHRRLIKKYRETKRAPFYKRYRRYWIDALLEDMCVGKEVYLLDCGCGAGSLLDILSQRHENIFGADLSVDMLGCAKEDNGRLRLAAADAQNLPFKDKTFDIVTCVGSLHHAREPYAALKEISRVLKDGGTLIASEPCRDFGLWRQAAAFYVKRSKNFSGGHRLFRTRELLEEIKRSGFEIKGRRKFGFAGFPLCGIPHQLPVMKYLPMAYNIAGFLIYTDELFVKVPVLNLFSWHVIVRAEKRDS
jgi:ubiquinone/menaquinone biosynthesis C-methylase UbiE